jgi:hypothetical protein
MKHSAISSATVLSLILLSLAVLAGACDSHGKAIVMTDAGTQPGVDAAPAEDTAGGAEAAADRVPDAEPVADAAALLDGQAPDTASPPPACTFTRHALRRLPPEIVLVLDRSGSMRTPVPGTDGTRWSEIRGAVEEVCRTPAPASRGGSSSSPAPKGVGSPRRWTCRWAEIS